MCIDYMTERDRKDGTGYQVVRSVWGRDGVERFNSLIYPRRRPVAAGMRADSGWNAKMIGLWGRGRYESGFHIFDRLRDAMTWGAVHDRKGCMVIVQVKYEGVRVTGVQDGRPAVVARYRTILKVVRRMQCRKWTRDR